MVLDFSRNYSPPGVYIEESDSTLVSPTGIPPTLVAIVGPGQGYQTNTEQVVLGDVAVVLAKKGVDTGSAKVTVAATGATVPTGDYTLTKTPGSPTDQNYTTALLAAAAPSVPVGTTVFVTYRYTDPTYYDPKHFESFEDVKDVYGEPLNTVVANPSDVNYQYVTSPLSLAAMVAIQNGATELVLVATTPPPTSASTEAAKSAARRSALNAAYSKIENDPSINVLVILPTGIATGDAVGVLSDLKGALTRTAAQSLFRFAVVGFDPAVDTAPDVLLATSGAKDRRWMLAYAAPGGLQMYSGSANSSFAVGHQYLAAGYAGRMAFLPVQQAITKQVIAGFSGLAGTPLSNSLKNQYSGSGVAVSEVDRFGRLSVRHGVTTDMTNVNTREASVVRARDALVTALADGSSASGLIGQPLDEDLLLSIKSAISGVLEAAVADEVILEYTGLTLRQLGTDPSVVEVKFAYRPAYPLNYIVISFSIDTSTGNTDLNIDETVV